jgi:hypothetical protein
MLRHGLDLSTTPITPGSLGDIPITQVAVIRIGLIVGIAGKGSLAGRVVIGLVDNRAIIISIGASTSTLLQEVLSMLGRHCGVMWKEGKGRKCVAKAS